MLIRSDGQVHPRPWNKGLLVGQKKLLQPKHVWSIRVRLEIALMWRDLALFNLAIDSKLRACDWVKLRIAHCGYSLLPARSRIRSNADSRHSTIDHFANANNLPS
jgi:hypothetical protein